MPIFTGATGGNSTIGSDNPNPQNPPNTPPSTGPTYTVGSVNRNWLLAYAGMWFGLSIMSDIPATQEFASVMALTIAIGASFVLIPKVTQNLKG